MDVHAQVAEFISRNRLLDDKQKVIVGVSGGADSLCLLDCLHRLRYALVLAHLDHQLRPESENEAKFCQQIAQDYGIPAVIEAADVRKFADAGRSLEEAARILRYRFLARVAKAQQAYTIATGHTADDQVETILMHFLRGAGPDGLHGMLPRTMLDDWIDVPEAGGIELVRPLLEITGEQTLAHCEAIGLQPIMDPSNEDPGFLRNRLRHELLPELETYNPNIRNALIRTGHLMADVADLQKEIVDEIWPEVATEAGENAVLLRVDSLLSKPVATQRALFRHAAGRLAPELRDISFEQIARWLAFVTERQTGSRQAMIGNLEMQHMGDEVLLWKPGSDVSFQRFPQLEGDQPSTLEVPGTLQLADGWTLKTTVGEITQGGHQRMMLESSKMRVFIDADKISGKLKARFWEWGDRIQVLGMKGRTKVAEIFVNEHVPQLLRARWPLVVDENQIVWVSGVRMAHSVRLTKSSKRYIELRLDRTESDP